MLRIRLAEPGDRELARQVLTAELGSRSPDSDPAVLTARIAGTARGQAGDQQGSAAVAWAIARLAGDGIGVAAFSLGQPSLDEVFLGLTGHATEEQHDHHHGHRAARRRSRPVPAGPRPAGPLRSSLILARRALLRIRHEPEQLADSIAIPVLFTLLFTYLFGGALAGSTRAYLSFLLPGTLVLAVC